MLVDMLNFCVGTVDNFNLLAASPAQTPVATPHNLRALVPPRSSVLRVATCLPWTPEHSGICITMEKHLEDQAMFAIKKYQEILCSVNDIFVF